VAQEKWSFYQTDVAAGYNRKIVALALDSAGNAYTSGWTGAANAHYDFMTAKHAGTTGAQQWVKNAGYKANTYDMANALAVDGAGNATSAGFFTVGANGLNKDFRTIRYTTAGAVKWSKGLGGTFGADDQAMFAATDAAGNVMILGQTVNSGGLQHDLTLVKYSAATGAVLWRKDALHSDIGSHRANTLLVDAAGNPVVISRVGSGEFYLAKHAAANGAILWQKPISLAATALDSVKTAVLDPAGNIILFGPTYETSSSFHPGFCTLKCDANSGAPIWEKTWRGPGFYGEECAGAATDADGNVFVTGASDNTSGNFEFRTIKYAAADGTLLWNTHTGPPPGHNHESKPSALVITPEGNPIATGSIISPKEAASIYDEDWDVFTVAYDGLTGYAIWERRWSAPLKADETPVREGFKLAPNGDVVIAGNTTGWGNHGLFVLSYANAATMPPGVMVVAPGDAAWPPEPLEEGFRIEFGKVLTWRAARSYLTIANTGGGVLSGLNFEIVGDHPTQFFIPTQPSSIRPNSSIHPEVSFQPSFIGSPVEGTASYSGPRTAILRISANGMTPVEIPLIGEAVTPQDLFSQWMADQGLSGPDAHADAFNLDASKADSRVLTPGGSSGLPAVSKIKVAETEYFQVEYVARFDNTLSYRLKTSTSLAAGSFQNASGWTVNSTMIDETWRRVTQRKAILPGTPKIFAVVEVTLLPVN
jgi:outer membrane protein assembly factor BamB